MVVTCDHTRCVPAPAGKAYTPRAGSLSFFGVQSLSWSDQGARASVDAEGRADLGNIDAMVFDGDIYRLEGSWGRMELVAARLSVDYH